MGHGEEEGMAAAPAVEAVCERLQDDGAGVFLAVATPHGHLHLRAWNPIIKSRLQGLQVHHGRQGHVLSRLVLAESRKAKSGQLVGHFEAWKAGAEWPPHCHSDLDGLLPDASSLHHALPHHLPGESGLVHEGDMWCGVDVVWSLERMTLLDRLHTSRAGACVALPTPWT